MSVVHRAVFCLMESDAHIKARVCLFFILFYSVNADRLAVQHLKGSPNSTQANMKGTIAKLNRKKQ